jgi:hypothetical protein
MQKRSCSRMAVCLGEAYNLTDSEVPICTVVVPDHRSWGKRARLRSRLAPALRRRAHGILHNRVAAREPMFFS